mgnify:CR=1 FL=1
MKAMVVVTRSFVNIGCHSKNVRKLIDAFFAQLLSISLDDFSTNLKDATLYPLKAYSFTNS